jgi:NitT/TauT family transport system ATP-binding protein
MANVASTLLGFESVSRTFVRRGDPSSALTAVVNVSFRVNEGEFVVLLGPTGCGKTTLLRMAAGLDFPTAGTVSLRGKRIEGPGRDRGMVFQSYSSFPWLTVRENVKFALRYCKTYDVAAWDEISGRLLNSVGLAEFSDRYVSELSGGMRQRLAIVRTLAADPDMLLMDEPFGALDAVTRENLQQTLLDVQLKSSKSILFVTHDVDEAVYLADRIVILSARPGTVFDEVSGGLLKPRALSIKFSKRFIEIKQGLVEQMRKESPLLDNGGHARI